ncbi:hypothetical protein PsalN5692_03794 (plasmid) [Piscirickettsia salmonis]|uniref:hypothetical protein n=1 Tax=Piscirickettsia salmonis TaxID=1238 RepID=UPI0012B9077F|nr:hypothetical protein [Piscirickettsia salmonis]QGP52286.1 hypothetical protein PsalN5692_03794 [Piscirickettsia salmonis]
MRLKVTIYHDEIWYAKNSESDSIFHVMPSIMTSNMGDVIPIFKLTAEQINFPNHDILFEIIYKDGSVDLVTPEPLIGRRLMLFLSKLRGDSGKGIYCCIDFINELMFGRGNVPLNTSPQSNWSNLSITESDDKKVIIRQNSNDVTTYNKDNIVFFVDDDDIFRHAALKIKHDIYLSLFGHSGGLMFSNHQEMLKAFSATKSFIAKKNQEVDKNHIDISYLPTKIIKFINSYLDEESKLSFQQTSPFIFLKLNDGKNCLMSNTESHEVQSTR